ncbi:hypothetical protein SSZBM1_85 [Synechococcus phage S-SZBM1]|uniref:Uncharacterized protein n=1 Tax=Synechococcus phage S-SZBM1 TaxID=2926475 RepID=A0AC61TSI1_9CAUD|nr:hypothetical protein PP650_gp191 [Synechococcus phage S-SZBM1]UNH61202.1 hypothetical protein SSZBM1_85 [Synechococcus phage S-SZBM1]
MKLLISEVLQKAHNAKTKAEKIKILRENDSQALRSILIINFDESVVSLLPEGAPPYTKNGAPEGTEHTKLEHESRILYHFFKGGSNIPMLRRETMFVQLLEGLHPDEAEVVIHAKDKTLHKRYKVTFACVQEAFPQIKWGGRS